MASEERCGVALACATEDVRVHPRAVVEDGAVLGRGCVIGPGAVVSSGARLGARVMVGANAVISGTVVVGADTRIAPCAVVGEAPQDVHYDGAPTRVVLGERVVVREGVTVHRGTLGDTIVEDDVMLMATSHVAHDCRVGAGAVLANGALLAGHVEVGRRAFVSGNAVVHQFARIGALAMIGGASRVNRDVPPYALLVGDSTLRGVNRVGLVRAGFDAATRAEVRELYRLLRASPTAAAAVPAMRERCRTAQGRALVEFLAGPSKRGFCRFGRHDPLD